MSFRDNVLEEADAQRTLRAKRQPIPANLRRYARRAGLALIAVSTLGSILVAVLGFYFGALYWGVILFFLALAAMGFVQLVTGRHLMTGR